MLSYSSNARTEKSNTVSLLEELAELHALAGENSFKVRAFQKASESLNGVALWDEALQTQSWRELQGIGKGISEVLDEYFATGRSSLLEQLKAQLPPGLVEIASLSGLGPKKARAIIDALGVHSLGELEYACQENRLLGLKGFGEKSQLKILEAIAFEKTKAGKWLLSDALEWSGHFLSWMRARIAEGGMVGALLEEAGPLRRRCEILERLDYVFSAPGHRTDDLGKRAKAWVLEFKALFPSCLPVEVEAVELKEFGSAWIQKTGSEAHLAELKRCGFVSIQAEDEVSIYNSLGLSFIPPECRESGREVALMKEGKFPDLVSFGASPSRLRGIFHNHTVYSDGKATVEELVRESARLGFEYLGISDHSQSAFYAQGLLPDRLLEQEAEIRAVQAKYPQVKLFWGIESDILEDGSLDYTSDVLKRFDFVIASVHSRFKMNQEEMTARLIKAIQNPATRFLGHPSGRLLLGRKPYPMDVERVIAEAARCDVAIELNANPQRLDLDWRWGELMARYGAMTSINPDAHELSGLGDVQYGIAMARKAMIPVSRVLNVRKVEDVAKWLRRQE